MSMKTGAVFVALGLVVWITPVATAAETPGMADTGPAAAVCVQPPAAANAGREALAAAPLVKRCGPCLVAFCPKSGVRCTFASTCGSGGCCNYTCVCDASCTTVGEAINACDLQVPPCLSCGPCEASYCAEEGTRCSFNNTCGPGGCCNYECAPDATCTGIDPLPVNAC